MSNHIVTVKYEEQKLTLSYIHIHICIYICVYVYDHIIVIYENPTIYPDECNPHPHPPRKNGKQFPKGEIRGFFFSYLRRGGD